MDLGRIKLFCLPYAGGSAEIYRKWKRDLDEAIELEPIELSGRGRRASESLYGDLENAVEDVYQTIRSGLSGDAYAIFGHSMGNLIAYEVCHKINERNHQPPHHIFFSGRGAPNSQNDKKIIHLLPDAEFKKELRKLGGTPDDVLDNDELLNYFLPIIRADFQIVERYQYVPRKHKLKSNITVFNGNQDDVRFDDLIEWRNHTDQKCRFINFQGGHFFIQDHTRELVQTINDILLPHKL